MKLILVNQRYGHTRTIVIRGWMKGFLSLCLMGAPVALGYLGYELAFADAGSSSLVSQESALASDEFIRGDQTDAYAGQVFADAGATPLSAYALFDAVNQVLSEPASDHLTDWQVLLAYQSSLLTAQPVDAVASFQHGRIIDPASYVHRTLH
ncbi:MAG: hypothetical protein Q8M35_11065 [Pseudohongiella sp.]|nr:hypothetical protein [Pseudohongiella sp.]